MRVLDLYCGAGGASMGYHMAGFDVYGIDKNPQPNYPFRFRQSDVLALSPRWIRKHFVAVVGSPPCQAHTSLKAVHGSKYHAQHEDLIPDTRQLMEDTGLPYIIENVEGARASLINPVRLCGSSFGLRLRRHRLFETNFEMIEAPSCQHAWQQRHRPYRIHTTAASGGFRQSGIVAIYGHNQMHGPARAYDAAYTLRIASTAMGIDWMTQLELNQAIPPVYTYWLGRRLRKAI